MDDLSAAKSEDVGLIVRAISFLCGYDPPTSQTDGQTDRRHAIAIRALHYSASRGKNSETVLTHPKTHSTYRVGHSYNEHIVKLEF